MPFRFLSLVVLLCVSPLLQAADVVAEALKTQRPLISAIVHPELEKVPPPWTHYKGREVAQTMHWQGAPWLWRETREKEENVTRLLDELKLKAGMTVCDLGAGSGYHAIRIGERVKPDGRVIAVDIQEKMLELLKTRADRAGVDNILRVMGQFHTAHLPKDSCDLILMVDVYHEVSHPDHILRHTRDALKKDGVIALVEFRAEDDGVPIKPLHKMSKKQAVAEFEENGLKLVRSYDELPWQHLLFFARDEDWTAREPLQQAP